jgi:hypothetical protein
MFFLPIPTLMYLWEIYFQDRSVHFAADKYMLTDPGNILIAHRHINVEIGTEAHNSFSENT